MVVHYVYPELSADQQQILPVLTAPAVALPAQFADSTHQLWQCETVAGAMILKLCQQQRVRQTPFWLCLNSLFELNFPHSLNFTKQLSEFLRENGGCLVPVVVAEQAEKFVMTRFMAGTDMDADRVDTVHIKQLAHHLGKLHQHSTTHWGSLLEPSLKAEMWPKKLVETIERLAHTSAMVIPEAVIQQAITAAGQINVQQFVPIMADLRWDQFRQTETGQLAVVDLDAFVSGPRELEFVLLEYLLSGQQITVFTDVYRQYADIPDLSNCRLSYRILLFLMYVLGETNLDRWLQHAEAFTPDNVPMR